MTSPASIRPPRNPGPRWGLPFLQRAERLLPAALFDWLVARGADLAVLAMPVERRHSRDYLAVVLGRPPRPAEIRRHFREFAKVLVVSLRVSNGRPYRCIGAEDDGALRTFLSSDRPALFGAFHLGHSDFLGFLLAQFGRRVGMVRLRVENSQDLDSMARNFGGGITFLWINDPSALPFAVKNAVEAGQSIALKCDRLGHAAKVEAFRFLGARRLFPFTLYHLAILFRLPVVLSAAVGNGPASSVVHSPPIFEPDPGASKEDNLARAREHFQGFLRQVEDLLRNDPYLWFNFLPLNPPAE